MNMHAKGTFEVTGWAEEIFGRSEGSARLARVNSTHSFQGDIEGEGTVEYVMVHADDSPVRFVGLERVIGKIGDREGTFVLELSGTLYARI
jgi:hypothetical protein